MRAQIPSHWTRCCFKIGEKGDAAFKVGEFGESYWLETSVFECPGLLAFVFMFVALRSESISLQAILKGLRFKGAYAATKGFATVLL